MSINRKRGLIVGILVSIALGLYFFLESSNSASENSMVAGKVTIRGRVFHKSDNPSFLDFLLPNPFDRGVIIAISSDSFGSFVTEESNVTLEQNDLQHAVFLLDESHLNEYGGLFANVQKDGRYSLQIPMGSYILCLANISLPSPPKTFPARSAGCVEVTATNQEVLKQDIFFGIAGVTSQ